MTSPHGLNSPARPTTTQAVRGVATAGRCAFRLPMASQTPGWMLAASCPLTSA
uniref:Uncharacterized protein n=1 Tax=uncultured marine virus TaxID=186617 RepID=A0A0F7L848_9VIRU|nr:hypothetical protein [uncultured marine virus]